ncbi:MAG TPA: hypothetical protein VGX48_10125 [Pyrinomonadaceae bacterium]|jgi:hypothetical protein|nr:hypothetical protein [Pyrinomonadaceae bacterium]
MAQFVALVWLKWRLFRNSLRSRRAVAGKVASAAGTLAGLVLSLALAVGMLAAGYFLVAPPEGSGLRPREGYVLLCFLLTTVFMMWALTPVALGGGGRFEPSRMLMYPISLRKLFAFDLLSDLTSLTAVFAVPAVFAVGLGAGLGTGRVAAALLVSACGVAFGMAFSKLLAVGVGALMRARRTRGETLLALLGAALGMTGALFGQLLPLAERYGDYFERARWTPPGAVAHAFSYGLRTEGGDYFVSLLVLAAYALAALVLAYRVARRTALGVGGGRARRSAAVKEDEGSLVRRHAGWRLPLVSAELSAVVEKELRYAARNAQLRVIGIMAIGLTIVIRMAPFGGGRQGLAALTPYAEGVGAVFSVLYIFTLVSPLSTNLFGYDGAGFRALVLSPVPRRKILTGKNLAVTLVTTALVALGVVAGGVFFGDLTPRAVLFVVLSFCGYAPLFALFGNWLSLQFPKRVEFGKRMSRSGVAGFMFVPFFLVMTVPPAAAVFAGHTARSHAVKYAILAAFAAAACGLYPLLINSQGRSLERRELEILDAVTGRGDDDGSRITG